MAKGYVESNNPDYQKWINKNVPINCAQACRTKSEEMAEEFLILRVVGVACTITGHGHAWCVDPEGKVVDPTSHQFINSYNYDKLTLELNEFPSKCPHCGDMMWKDTPGVRAYLGENADEVIHDHLYCRENMLEELINDGIPEEEARRFVGL